MNHSFYRYLSFLIFTISCLSLQAQLSDWDKKQSYKIENTSSKDYTSYSFPLTINTQALIASGDMLSSGDDIRIATDCDGSTVIPHWVESGIGTSSTKIWCLLPNLPANSSDTVYVFYGNAAADNTSDFDLTFPSQLIIDVTDTLTGLITDSVWEYNYILIDEDVLVKFDPTLTLPWRLRMSASKIEIKGTIFGKGMGFAGTVNGNGQGPGGGTQEITGGGGGAYGGNGGFGSYGSNPDSRGVGGTAYGTKNGFDIQAGSAGGAAGSVGAGNPGANGGMSFKIETMDLAISGNLNAEGLNGTNTEVSYSPGGGAGGGILIETENFTGGGKLLAKGGNGGNSETLYYAGGGAGGGRIKIFYSGNNNFSGQKNVAGGFRGLGGITPGEDGEPGTIHDSLVNPRFITTPLNSTTILTQVSGVLCHNIDVVYEAPAGASNYTFYLDNAVVQNGASNQYTLNSSSNQHEIYCEISNGNCSVTTDIIRINLNPEPNPGILSNGNTYCQEDSLLLVASVGSGSNFDWYLDGQNLNLPNTSTIYAKSPGNYSIQETDVNQCFSETNAKSVAENAKPSSAVDAASLSFCEGDSILFSTQTPGDNSSFIWRKEGNTIQNSETIWIKEGGNYSSQGVSEEGCLGDVFDFTVTEKAAPQISVSLNGLAFICNDENPELSITGISNEDVKWFKDGQEIPNEISSTLSVSESGTYYAEATSTDGCKADTRETEISDFEEAAITSLLPTTFCPGDSTILASNNSPELQLDWYLNGVLHGNNSNEKFFDAGEVMLVISNAAGCIDSSSVTVLSQHTPEKATLMVDESAICEGYEATISTDFTGSYTWVKDDEETDVTNEDLIVSEAGNYWLNSTDGNGCKNTSDTVLITVNPLPETPVVNLDDDSLFTAAGENYYQWYLNGVAIVGANEFYYIAMETGDYSVEIANEFGCLSELSNEVAYTGTVGINEQDALKVTVFPNPSEGMFTLSAPHGSSYTVRDALGRTVEKGIVLDKYTKINLDLIGAYILEITLDQQKSAYRKLIVQ